LQCAKTAYGIATVRPLSPGHVLFLTQKFLSRQIF